MKKLLFLFLFFISYSFLSAQDSMFVQMRVEYSVTSHPLLNKKAQSDWMYLDIGKESYLYYSYFTYYQDSVKRKMFRENKDVYTIMDELRLLKNGSLLRFVTDLKRGKYCYLDSIIVLNGTRAEEPIDRIEWEIAPENYKVLDYNCKKATGKYKGRTWYVWFTPEIPVSAGPWKLQGLPGVVLHARDDQKHYVFVAKVIRQFNLMKQYDFSQGHKPISMKAYKHRLKSFAEEPDEYLCKMTNSWPTFPEPKQPKNKYNPLELDWKNP